MKKKKLKDSSRTKTFFYLWLLTLLIFFTFGSYAIANPTSYLSSIEPTLQTINIYSGISFFFLALISAIVDKKQIQPKNKQYSKFLSSTLFALIVGSIATSTISAISIKNLTPIKNDGAKTVVIPTPSPKVLSIENELFTQVNTYRKFKNLKPLLFDSETCDIAERIVNTPGVTSVKIADYQDLCPKCNSLGFNQSLDIYDAYLIMSSWKTDDATQKNLESTNTYGCIKQKGNKVILATTSKTSSGTSNNAKPTTNEKITNDPNEAIHCGIDPRCGGGTKPLKRSECDQAICCEIHENQWELVIGRDKCDSIQKANGEVSNDSNSNNIPTTSVNKNKVAFQATETTSKGTYYCYEDNVNTMSTQQSLVKSYRELYESCKNSSYTQQQYTDCSASNGCYNLTGSESEACYKTCYDLAYGDCNTQYATYSSERQKLDNMRWDYCP